MAHKVIVPQKIMSRSFLNNGTLIVIPTGIGDENLEQSSNVMRDFTKT
jgi:hypothetical protein